MRVKVTSKSCLWTGIGETAVTTALQVGGAQRAHRFTGFAAPRNGKKNTRGLDATIVKIRAAQQVYAKSNRHAALLPPPAPAHDVAQSGVRARGSRHARAYDNETAHSTVEARGAGPACAFCNEIGPT